MLRGGEVFRGLAGTSRRISANTANEYLEILSFGLVDREREREPRRLESGNFKREGQSFAEQVDAEIVHCGYRITRDIVPRLRFLPSPQTLTKGVRSKERRKKKNRQIFRRTERERESVRIKIGSRGDYSWTPAPTRQLFWKRSNRGLFAERQAER